MPTPKRITIVLADQHAAVRAGIQAALPTKLFRVLAAVDNGRDAVRLAHKLKPDVVILDIPMLRLCGTEAARQIVRARKTALVLFYSGCTDPHFIRAVIRSGARGFVIKAAPVEVLPRAIARLMAGERFFSPSIERHLKEHEKLPGYTEDDPNQLTSREIEVGQLIADSFSAKQIAVELGISEPTVIMQRGSLMRKIKVHDAAGVTRFMIRAGYSAGTKP